MINWLSENSAAIFWVAVSSAVMFVGALLVVPWAVVRIPADYYAHPERSGARWPGRRLWFRILWVGLKNVLGLGFLFFGTLMLVLPGQGILTLLLGLSLVDFPGKFQLQRRLVSRPSVLNSMNWIRKRAGREPLRLEP